MGQRVCEAFEFEERVVGLYMNISQVSFYRVWNEGLKVKLFSLFVPFNITLLLA
jgi:hypothetical protein